MGIHGKLAAIAVAVATMTTVSAPASADWRNSGYDGTSRNNAQAISSARSYKNQSKFDSLQKKKEESVKNQSTAYRGTLHDEQKAAREELQADQDKREREFFEQKEQHRVNILLPTLERLRLQEGGWLQAEQFERRWIADWKAREERMRDGFESEWGNLRQTERSQYGQLADDMKSLSEKELGQKQQIGDTAFGSRYEQAKAGTRQQGIVLPQGIDKQVSQHQWDGGVTSSYYNSKSRHLKPRVESRMGGKPSVVDWK